MKVFKFGGASVKDAEAVKNVERVLGHFRDEPLLIVVSAMGKTTNAMERLADAYFHKREKEKNEVLKEIRDFHQGIVEGLIKNRDAHTYDDIDNLLIELECTLEMPVEGSYDFNYDQIVCFGEILSTRIISSYLKVNGMSNRWIDSRNFIQTDSNFREARVDWDMTASIISRKLKPIVQKQMVVTQGFIGQSSDKHSVTLGREGSDYSAAIFAYGLNAESVSIWKDVAGVMNSDPKRFSDAQLVEALSYDVTIELAYYGATVIHPKTIQPLRSKNIPLYVRSFSDMDQVGTTVSKEMEAESNIPFYIVKEKQALISLSSKDFSYIVEEHLGNIFSLMSHYGIRVNLMQNSAISFSLVVNDLPEKIEKLVSDLSDEYQVTVLHQCELLTVRNHAKADLDKIVKGRDIHLEQRDEKVLQLLVEA